MKYLSLITTVLVIFSSSTMAEESISEKSAVKINSAKRSLKKSTHRAQESVCGTLTNDNKVQCLAKEEKNRLKEAGDAIKDKSSELKNKMDSNAE